MNFIKKLLFVACFINNINTPNMLAASSAQIGGTAAGLTVGGLTGYLTYMLLQNRAKKQTLTDQANESLLEKSDTSGSIKNMIIAALAGIITGGITGYGTYSILQGNVPMAPKNDTTKEGLNQKTQVNNVPDIHTLVNQINIPQKIEHVILETLQETVEHSVEQYIEEKIEQKASQILPGIPQPPQHTILQIVEHNLKESIEHEIQQTTQHIEHEVVQNVINNTQEIINPIGNVITNIEKETEKFVLNQKEKLLNFFPKI